MGADDLGEAFGRGFGPEQVIGGFGGSFAVYFTPSGDFTDGRQARPAMPFLQPDGIVTDAGHASFAAAMISLDQRP